MPTICVTAEKDPGAPGVHRGYGCSKDLGLDVLGPRIHRGPKCPPLSTLNPTANVFPRHPGSPSRSDTRGRGPHGDMGVGKCREGDRLEETQGERVTAPVPLWGQPRLARSAPGRRVGCADTVATSQELFQKCWKFWVLCRIPQFINVSNNSNSAGQPGATGLQPPVAVKL